MLSVLLSGKEIKTEFVEAIGCPMPEAPRRPCRPTARTWPRSFRKTARNATARGRSGRSRWTLTTSGAARVRHRGGRR